MQSLTWNRPRTIQRLRGDVWRYVTAASKTNNEVVLNAAALLGMRASDVRVLAQLQFVLSDEVRELLAEMPRLARRLPTTTVEEVEAGAERVRGSIRWGETVAARAALGLPHIFVTAPARRAYNTSENELLAFSLSAVRNVGQRTGWERSTSADAGVEVRNRINGAARWRSIRPLADVSDRAPGPTAISRVRSGRQRRSFAKVLAVVDLHRRYIAQLDRHAVREAVEQHALVTREDSRLLELLCLFSTLEALDELGWRRSAIGLLRPPLVARARKGNETLAMFFQHAPKELTAGSRYRVVQQAHGFAKTGGLIPDIVLRIDREHGSQWLMLEVKGVERSVASSARAALLDLLGYRRAFDPVIRQQAEPYGVGIAWGYGLDPSASEVVLCSPDTIRDALHLAMG